MEAVTQRSPFGWFCTHRGRHTISHAPEPETARARAARRFGCDPADVDVRPATGADHHVWAERGVAPLPAA